MLKKSALLLFPVLFSLQLKAQTANCTFKPPFVTINFGSGSIKDLNTGSLSNYDLVGSSCPTDGHYTYTSYTSNCFSGDWHTVTEDHTPGDADGNMLIVNASYYRGVFMETTISGFKGNTTYEFGVWLMNVCRISEKCPFPLLPNLSIRLQTMSGKHVAHFNTGDLTRDHAPKWTQHRAVFTTPANETALKLVMADNAPGGCGNDFALDDITFRECVKTPPPESNPPKTAPVKPKTEAPKTVKKENPEPVKRPARIVQVDKPQTNTPVPSNAVLKKQPVFSAPPPVLTTRANPLVRHIETEAGEIKLDLYDNGEIDGDTVSIYHNNTLLVSRARLSQKPISFRIAIDPANPHHELIMVAENLGSIPPNTSLMIVTAGSKRYQVFISSSEQKNAKVVFDLKR